MIVRVIFVRYLLVELDHSTKIILLWESHSSYKSSINKHIIMAINQTNGHFAVDRLQDILI